MIIVYLSIALIIGALIYLGITAYKTYKDAKPAIEKLSDTASRVQVQTDTLKVESNKLTENQQQLMNDVDEKKEAVMQTVDAAKQTPKSIKKLVKIKPIARFEHRMRFKQMQIQARKRELRSE
ncbi:DUF948 domain-containing protein [Mesobacillus harenae]|uniref:DUF948 domain-containing protein n=1 Tax=Mesobacillus harenae TaxID=2213203 RepID=UPI0015809CD9|nr:DUF948 domain-containing protein [Mesobacillus harenae]